MSTLPITIKTIVHAPLAKVWECWTLPEHIDQWAFATNDWEASAKENNLTVGGTFRTVMGAKDKSASFDFSGKYTAVEEINRIEYDLDDARHVKIIFTQLPQGVEVVQTFDPENENPIEMQRDGWQAFLDNFKKHVESELA